MESSEIEIGTRKLRRIGGSNQMTIPALAMKMLQIKTGDNVRCWLDGSTLLIRKE